jgi:carbonic anhydrase
MTHLVQRGIERDTIQKLKEEGFDLDSWLQGMDNVKTAVKQSVTLLKTHPLMPSNVIIRGFIMDISCGRLSSVS